MMSAKHFLVVSKLASRLSRYHQILISLQMWSDEQLLSTMHLATKNRLYAFKLRNNYIYIYILFLCCCFMLNGQCVELPILLPEQNCSMPFRADFIPLCSVNVSKYDLVFTCRSFPICDTLQSI